MSRFRKILIWIVIIISLISFLLSSNSNRRSWNPAEQIAIEITAPVQEVAAKISSLFKNLWTTYVDLIDVRHENRLLKIEIDSLRLENSRYRELSVTYKKLDELLKFKHTIDRPAIAAMVTGLDPTGWFKSIIINKGINEGVQLDMPVVNSDGLVGRVVSVSPNYSKVLLIIDQNSSVDCIVQRSRDGCIAKGISTDVCSLDYVVESSDVSLEDMIVTSGLGGVFPKGIPVGRVRDIEVMPGKLFKKIMIRTSVNFSKLENVLVVLGEIPSKPQM